jgi:MtN3 and saliva related transmembrane protein
MYLLFTLGVSAWAVYGLWVRDWPVFWANIVTLLPAAAVLERKVRAYLRSARE